MPVPLIWDGGGEISNSRLFFQFKPCPRNFSAVRVAVPCSFPVPGICCPMAVTATPHSNGAMSWARLTVWGMESIQAVVEMGLDSAVAMVTCQHHRLGILLGLSMAASQRVFFKVLIHPHPLSSTCLNHRGLSLHTHPCPIPPSSTDGRAGYLAPACLVGLGGRTVAHRPESQAGLVKLELSVILLLPCREGANLSLVSLAGFVGEKFPPIFQQW